MLASSKVCITTYFADESGRAMANQIAHGKARSRVRPWPGLDATEAIEPLFQIDAADQPVDVNAARAPSTSPSIMMLPGAYLSDCAAAATRLEEPNS